MSSSSIPYLPALPGLRWTWRAYPNTVRPANAAAHAPASGHANASLSTFRLPPLVVPLACMLQPFDVNNPVTRSQLNPSADPSSTAPPVAPPIPLLASQDLQRCRTCGAAWNPACIFDVAGGYWACPMCLQRNKLPTGFTHSASSPHPVISYPVLDFVDASKGPGSSSSVEQQSTSAIFIIDLCMPPEELAALRESLFRSLQSLPPATLVGVIGVGRGLTLWELGFEAMNKCYSFRGNKAYNKAELLQTLGLGPNSSTSSSQQPPVGASADAAGRGAAATANGGVFGRFLVPFSTCEFTLTSIFEDLSPDPFPVPTGERPQRATGVALDLAATLLEVAYGSSKNSVAPSGGRVLLFTAGPTTRGPGTVVSSKKNEMLRSHRDLTEGNAPLCGEATEYYNGVATRLSDCSCCVDIFIGSLDQVGLLEMRNLADATGGVVVNADSFSQKLFSESFHTYMKKVLSLTAGNPEGESTSSADVAYGCRIELHCTADTLVTGALGHTRVPGVPVGHVAGETTSSGGGSGTPGGLLAAMMGTTQSPTSASAPTPVRSVGSSQPRTVSFGIASDSNTWFVAAMDRRSALAFLFDTETLTTAPTPPVGACPVLPGLRLVQFIVSYTRRDGQRRIRVITAAQPILASDNPALLAQSLASGNPAAPADAPSSGPSSDQCPFDQYTAAVVMARMCVHGLLEQRNYWDMARRWLDRVLVRFVKKFGSYTLNQPQSLKLARDYSLLPTLLFNFRRSEYFMWLNISPDESTYKNHYLMRENVDHVLLMMQPTVDLYGLDCPYATPAPLDSSSIVPDKVLLMDAFFNVHILLGHVLHEWQKAGYFDKPEYAHLKQLVDRAVGDATTILHHRFPFPRYSLTDQHGSEARHVLTKLNPSVTHNSIGAQDSRAQFARGVTGNAVQEVIYTDDANIQRFMETLRQAVVTPEN